MKCLAWPLLFIFALPILVTAQPNPPLWTNSSPPCGARQDEIFFSLIGQGQHEGLSLEVWDILDGPNGTKLGPTYILPDTPIRINPNNEWEIGCHWIATTDSSPIGNTVRLSENVLYKFIVFDGGVPKVDFLWANCSFPIAENFYCGATTGGRNDTYVFIDYNSFDYEIHVLDFQMKRALIAVDGSIGFDDDLLFSHDIDYFCDRIGHSTNSSCKSSSAIDIFLTDQADDPREFTHTSEDLLVSAGAGWTQSWSIGGDGKGGSVSVKLQPGTEFEVQGAATLKNITIEPTSPNASYKGLRVADSGSLSLREGTVIKLPATEFVWAFGQLNVAGTETDPVTFERSDPTGKWGGLYLIGSAADNSSINHARFDYGSTCLGVFWADGISITNSEFNNCLYNGISSYAASGVVLKGDTLSDQYDGGVYLKYGDARIETNLIQNSGSTGLSVVSSYVMLLNEYEWNGYNTIKGSGSDDIFVTYSSVDMGDVTNANPGKNSIYSATGYEVYAENNSEVYAEGNWWGEYPPNSSDFFSDASSTLDTWSPLSQNPNAGKGGGETAAIRPIISPETIITGDTSPGSAGRFVRYIASLRNRDGRSSSASVLSTILADKKHPQRGLAASYYVDDLAHLGDDLLAVMRGEEYLTESSIPSRWKSGIAKTLFFVYSVDVKSTTGASRMRDLLTSYDPLDSDIGLLDALLSDLVASSGGSVTFGKRGEEIVDAPNILDIDVNTYPNPFSAATTIEFTLVEPARIELAVYDVLGREVKRLVEASLPEGHYNYRFDPGNLAQGLYLYRLRADGRVKAGTMIYAK